MTLRHRSWGIALATTGLSLAAACGPSVVPEVGGTDSEGSSGTTDADSANPNPTTPMTSADPSVGTGDVTGDPTVDPATTDPTTPGDTTSGSPNDACCEPHEEPGCNEEAVVECVCSVEASCCAFEWSQDCVDLAMGKCMATCEDPPETTGEETTTGMGADCSELVEIELLPADATHTGAWELSTSQVLPYDISLLNQRVGTEGSILFEPDIPCNDTWYIWVQYWQQGSDDSYFATLDGEPMPPAIFEGDCSQFGQGYDWAVLNWRDEADPACTYQQDPWTPDWAAGVHEIEFSFRESPAMGRIVITNDQDYVPM